MYVNVQENLAWNWRHCDVRWSDPDDEHLPFSTSNVCRGSSKPTRRIHCLPIQGTCDSNKSPTRCNEVIFQVDVLHAFFILRLQAEVFNHVGKFCFVWAVYSTHIISDIIYHNFMHINKWQTASPPVKKLLRENRLVLSPMSWHQSLMLLLKFW